MTQAWRAFGHLLPLFVTAAAVAVPIATGIARHRVQRYREPWRVAALTVAAQVAAVGSALAVLAIALEPTGPVGGVYTTANWMPFATIYDQVTAQVDASVAIRNVLFNILLFLPVGFTWTWLAKKAGRPWSASVLAGFGLSVLVELAQLVFPLGRAVDVDDVLLNTLGVLIGAGMACVARTTISKLGMRTPTRA